MGSHSWGCDGTGDNCEHCRDLDKIKRGWKPPNWWPESAQQYEIERLEGVKQDVGRKSRSGSSEG